MGVFSPFSSSDSLFDFLQPVSLHSRAPSGCGKKGRRVRETESARCEREGGSAVNELSGSMAVIVGCYNLVYPMLYSEVFWHTSRESKQRKRTVGYRGNKWVMDPLEVEQMRCK